MDMIRKFAAPLVVLSLAFGLTVIVWVSAALANPDYWARTQWGKTDFSKTSVDFGEIRSGGPPRDGIPPIDEPKFAPIAEAGDLADTEPVITVYIGGEARAYPLRILIWHEIVNDRIAGTPVAVTYCPLCNSAIVFDRRVDGRLLDFGTTGMLRNSDLVMYDRQTESWWQQFTGEAIVGSLTGTELTSIPARLESFSLFRKRHPAGVVLVANDPSARDYGLNPYTGYDTQGRPYSLFNGPLPDYINPMARVVTFKADGKPQAIALTLLTEKTALESGDVVVAWSPGQNSALDRSVIAKSRDVGNITVQRKTAGTVRDVVYDVTFAFVFHAFHPDIRIRQE